MPRTVYCEQYYGNRQEIEPKIADILMKDGYREVEQDGDAIWTKGDVKLAGVSGIKVEYGVDQIKFFGWIQGLVGGETPLHGLAGAVRKRSVIKTIEKLRLLVNKND